MKMRNNIEATLVCSRVFCFFFAVFIHARTCPPSFPRETEQRREGGGEDEGRGEKKREDTQLNEDQTSYSCFSVPFWRMEDEEGGGVAEWGKAGFDVFPICNVKPVDSQQPQHWILEIYSCDKSCRAPPV